MDVMRKTVLLSNGRAVSVHQLTGSKDGRTVVLCHPTPGSGAFDPDPEATARRGITLIAVDRPGYGASEPVGADEWSTVSGAADDLAEVLGRLGTGAVGLAGWAAGGWMALALAARRPELVDRIVLIGTPAPDDDVPWLSPERRERLAALRGAAPAEAHRAVTEMVAASATVDPHSTDALELLGGARTDSPALVESGNAEQRLGGMLAVALAQRVSGLAADIAGCHLRPWEFEPGDVPARTLCLYGSKDPAAGSRHGGWWQKRLPNARLEMVPGAGPLLIVPMWGRVLSHLVPRRRS